MNNRAGRRALRCWELKQREALENCAKAQAYQRTLDRNLGPVEAGPDQVTVSRTELGGSGEGTVTISGLNALRAAGRNLTRKAAQARVAFAQAMLEQRTRELLAAAESLEAKAEQRDNALPADWRQPCDHLATARASSLLTDQRHRRKRSTTTQLCARRAALVGTVAPTAPPVAVGTTTTAQLCADKSGVATPM